MNIIVCVKQVPSTNEVRLDPEKHTIIRDGRQSVINPFDTHGVEAAVALKEKHGGKISCLSMGIPATERLLRDAIACGANDALLLTDRAFAGADTYATAYALACGVRKMTAPDLIICGKMAVDGDTAQIGPELASQLDIPFLSDVTEIIESAEDHLICRCQTDGGSIVARMELPGLITVTRELNQPRFPSIAGIRASQSASVISMGYLDVEADPELIGLKGSPTRVVKSYAPEKSSSAEILEGPAAELSKTLLNMIREAK